jgi:molybdate transport system substrate-binding protein
MLQEGRYWVIPNESHSDIEQVYVVLKKGKGKESIRRFLDFIRGEKGGKILSRYGFVIPCTGDNRT